MDNMAGFTVHDGQLPESADELIARLAKLDRASYETARTAEAAARKWRPSELDKMVAEARGADGSNAVRQGRAIHIERPAPWPEAVDGGELLTEIAAFLARHVFLPPGAADAIGVWALHTHCFAAFRNTPRLAFTSPEKRCGKTTALDALSHIVSGPLPTANITSAALFRTIERAAPAMMIDEADTFLRHNDDLRAALNAGHKRGGQVIRCVGDDAEPRAFGVFGPAAIAAIGRLPGTIEDRSIMVRMKRATRAERRAPLDRSAEAEGMQLARMCARWAQDHGANLIDADPKLPPALFNRSADNWRALFAIAERAGGGWWVRLESASAVLMPDDDAEGRGVQLLADIKRVMGKTDVESAFSETLVKDLIELEESPWGEANKGRAMTQIYLATLLGQFGIKSGSVRIGDKTAKGYHRSRFEDAWARYLDEAQPEEASQRHNPRESGTSGQCNPSQSLRAVTVRKAKKPVETAGCDVVTVRTQEAGGWI
jgi:putative DNA primase/helicase